MYYQIGYKEKVIIYNYKMRKLHLWKRCIQKLRLLAIAIERS